ncbi:hypothetical protein [Gemmatimonas sp.]|uniref:hypothetical protein n=1 Tax=Gemmatimonas sp. TaxID=1962908 RepID=UPI003342AD8C
MASSLPAQPAPWLDRVRTDALVERARAEDGKLGWGDLLTHQAACSVAQRGLPQRAIE